MNVSLVPEGARVADIGCDHGYASIWLIENGIADRVIATDSNRGPIERAKEHICRYGLDKQIECRQGDGLEKLIPGEVDTLMIAGMGGPLMMRILDAGKEVVERIRTLVLQPQSEIGAVRKYIIEAGFSINREKICLEDGKYYFALLAEKSEEPGTEVFDSEWKFRYGIGLIQEKNPVMKQYLERERNTYVSILGNAGWKGKAHEKKAGIERRIHEIDECLEKMETCGKGLVE